MPHLYNESVFAAEITLVQISSSVAHRRQPGEVRVEEELKVSL
jgi:hypothetical protein